MAGFGDEAHAAWTRLRAWHRDGDGRAALDALDDIASVRRLVDQAEVAAVQAARRAGESWSVIAARAGMSRQSAWERWRDLDGTDGEPPPVATRPATFRKGRPRRLVEVPDVVGLTVQEALGILTGAGLDAESATPELPLLAPAEELRSATVVRQYPDPGTRVRGATVVRLWLERGDGSAGVREPRRPPPPLRAGQMPISAQQPR